MEDRRSQGGEAEDVRRSFDCQRLRFCSPAWRGQKGEDGS